MTFKHGKFEDSSTMRSFTKVAEQKGWVKSEPLQKKASADSLDLTPTASLTENVLKLCAGLRQSGMDKYADEVEKNFFNYKRANDLYNVHKEKGDDLVDAAHPDGSHKMEGVEGDAVIETILDKHLMHLKMIDKKPTGKLATSLDILKAVKVVLAQDTAALQSKLDSLMAGIRSAANSITNLTEADLTVSWSGFAQGIVDLTQKPSIANLKKIKDIMGKQYTRLKPGGVIFSGISEEAWIRVEPKIGLINSNADKAMEVIRQMVQVQEKGEEGGVAKEEAKETPSDEKPRVGTDPYPNSTKFSQQIQQTLNAIRGYKASVSSDPDYQGNNAEKAGIGNAWLDKRMQEVQGIQAQWVKETDPAAQNEMAASLLSTLQKIQGRLAQFRSKWIG